MQCVITEKQSNQVTHYDETPKMAHKVGCKEESRQNDTQGIYITKMINE